MVRVFGTKKITCSCRYTFDVKTNKLTSRKCAHCGNDVVFDQSKGDSAVCPVCHEKINEMSDKTKVEEFSCAQCGVKLIAAKNAHTCTCPVCDCVNDVQSQLTQERIKKDGLASIIKYEGDNDTLVWKHPIEDFNLGSQLIVHESQEAVFFRDGQALDTFGPGRYTLETQQLPILEKLYKLPTDTDGTFHSEVYFINKTVQMAIKWGTPDKVRFIDPLTSTPLELGASGEMNIAVDNGRKLLIKLVGTMKGISWGDGSGFTKSLQSSFRPLIVNAVKTNLPAVIKQNEIDILEIDEKLDLISESLCGITLRQDKTRLRGIRSDYSAVLCNKCCSARKRPEFQAHTRAAHHRAAKQGIAGAGNCQDCRSTDYCTVPHRRGAEQGADRIGAPRSRNGAPDDADRGRQARSRAPRDRGAGGSAGAAFAGTHRSGDHGGEGLQPEGCFAGGRAKGIRRGHRQRAAAAVSSEISWG